MFSEKFGSFYEEPTSLDMHHLFNYPLPITNLIQIKLFKVFSVFYLLGVVAKHNLNLKRCPPLQLLMGSIHIFLMVFKDTVCKNV